jgi:hypothetical protein
VDLTTTHVYSNGLGPIIEAHKQLRGTERKLVLKVTPGSPLEHMLRVTNLDTMLVIKHTDMEVERELGAPDPPTT